MKNFVMNEEGQGMVEYGLIIALVAIIVIAGISLLGKNIGNLFNTVADNVK